MKNGLIALINGSFSMCMCCVRGNGSQPPRTGTDTWDEDCGYRPYITTQRMEHRTLQDIYYSYNPQPPQVKVDSANWTWQTGWGEPPHVPRDAGLLFNIPQSSPTVKGAIHRPVLLQNPGSFFKQDVCLRPPSPQINNPQNLISGGRVEALESHYFHIPYPGALGLLRECGRPGAVKAPSCGGNLRPSARLQWETSWGSIINI